MFHSIRAPRGPVNHPSMREAGPGLQTHSRRGNGASWGERSRAASGPSSFASDSQSFRRRNQATLRLAPGSAPEVLKLVLEWGGARGMAGCINPAPGPPGFASHHSSTQHRAEWSLRRSQVISIESSALPLAVQPWTSRWPLGALCPLLPRWGRHAGLSTLAVRRTNVVVHGALGAGLAPARDLGQHPRSMGEHHITVSPCSPVAQAPSARPFYRWSVRG